jgi:hypothetical protein
MKSVLATLLLVSSTFAVARQVESTDHDLGLDQPRWYGVVHVGQSFLELGSEDKRQGWAIGAMHVKHEPRFCNSKETGNLAYYAYLTDTHSLNHPGRGSSTIGFGFIALLQNHRMWNRKLGYYYSLGWGLQYVNQSSIDLDSQLNSTPVGGLGLICFLGKQEYRIGLDYLHISNAGLQGSNQGQNQLCLALATRF